MYETLKIQKDARLPKGSHDTLSAKYKISVKTVKRLWQPVRAALLNGDTKVDISVKRKGNCGRKKKNRKEITDAIKIIRFKDRRSLRTMQVALKRKGVDVSLSTLSSIGKKCKTIWKKKLRLKPMLAEEHRRERFEFCSLNVNEELMTYPFSYDVVHINEKWFYTTEEGEAYWATAEEDMAYRASKSKRFIKNVCLWLH